MLVIVVINISNHITKFFSHLLLMKSKAIQLNDNELVRNKTYRCKLSDSVHFDLLFTSGIDDFSSQFEIKKNANQQQLKSVTQNTTYLHMYKKQFLILMQNKLWEN